MKQLKFVETDLTRQVKGLPTDSWTCPECKGTATQYSLKIVATGQPGHFPKYIPQIREACRQCGRYRRFAPQSSILIKRFNDRLQHFNLPATGRDFYEEGRGK